jgi:hypothetical protein
MQQDEFRALHLAQRHFTELLSRLPADAKKRAMEKIINRSYNSSLTHVLDTVYEGWDCNSTRLMARTMESLHAQIKGIRELMKERAVYGPITKHTIRSRETIRNAIQAARPSANHIETKQATGTKVIPEGRTINVELSPGYYRFTEKLGISQHKGLVFLNGFRAMTPYDGAEVWNCAAYDTSRRETRIVYVGKIDKEFIVHTNASYCTTTLQKRAAARAIAAMKASMVG